MAMHVMFRRDLNELKVSRKAERPHVRPRVGALRIRIGSGARGPLT